MFEREQNRYRMLEPIRQFARQLLEDSDEDGLIAGRHAQWAFRRARETLAARSAGDAHAEERLQPDLDNVHAALDWLREHDRMAFLRMVSGLGLTWFHSDWRRGRATAEQALVMAHDAPDRVLAGIVFARGLLEQRDHFSISYTWLEDARALYLSVGSRFAAAWSTFWLAGSYSAIKPQQAEHLLREAMRRFRELKVPGGEVACLVNLGGDAYEWGRLDEAKDHLERALAVVEATSDKGLYALVLGQLARANAACGQNESACRQMSEAVELLRRDGDRWTLQSSLSDAAWLEVCAKRLDRAESLVRQAVRECLDIDESFGLGVALLVLASIHDRQGRSDDARALVAATGWDYEAPAHQTSRPNSLLATTLRELTPLFAEEYEAAAQEGRSLGLFEAARRALR